MAYQRLKTEMKGDTSRWGRRAPIKHAADRLRREADKRASAEGVRAATDRVLTITKSTKGGRGVKVSSSGAM